jgi:hypothetical protein
VISPDGADALNRDYLLLMPATPGDNRLHTVDARDAALAFANSAERPNLIKGKVLLIGGDDSHLHLHRDVEDDMFQAIGLGRLGPAASLPGDPWVAASQSRAVRLIARTLGPLLRPLVRTALIVQRRVECRGPYADPWTLIAEKLGTGALASANHPTRA